MAQTGISDVPTLRPPPVNVFVYLMIKSSSVSHCQVAWSSTKIEPVRPPRVMGISVQVIGISMNVRRRMTMPLPPAAPTR